MTDPQGAGPISFDAETALLMVDLQVDLLDAEGRLPVAQAQVDGLLDQVSTLVALAVAEGARVAYVNNAFPKWSVGNLFRKFAVIRGSAGAELDPRVPRVDAPTFEKWRSSAFCNPALEAWLRENGVRRVVIVGVYADACVRRTVEAARARGFAVVVPRAGVASRSQAAVERGLAAIARAGATVAGGQRAAA